MIKAKLFFYYFLLLLLFKTSELIQYTNPHIFAWFIIMISFIFMIGDKIYELAKELNNRAELLIGEGNTRKMFLYKKNFGKLLQ